MAEYDNVFSRLNTSKIDIATTNVAMNIGACIGGLYNGIFISIRSNLKDEKRETHISSEKIADIALEIFKESLNITAGIVNTAIEGGNLGNDKRVKELHEMLSQFHLGKPGNA